ncbi:Dihydrofolate reductase [Flagellimonas maritima]|uniref:Dihydrofolate reductase n=1 Tax=Flagellimonas maritima TaxID=1383885 RepID=A0A2Z4LTC9_9FLAO|nr:dihydrofolate reductase [Allomuricauda aurantiaca]AWX45201.1 Dihydrofolate reductase [Allomuricauda aurantiaca]
MKQFIIIAAAGENNALGINNDLPWHLPDDFKRFKNLTTGHKIIMGRKTLESFAKALPNREHIVITRDKDYIPKFECTVVHSLEHALDLAANEDKSFIIGGGQIYEQAMEFATDIELTRIHSSFEADTFFPEIDKNIWSLVKEEYHPKDGKHAYNFTYLTYRRQ